MANFITKHIPNTITSLNLFSGCMAVMQAFESNYTLAALFIILGAIFDFFDGMSARMLKAYSPLGKELDSLADLVTFGVAPSVMIFSLLQESISFTLQPSLIEEYLPYTAFLIAIFSALRLAKFNIDERQTTSFIGLPTPANALFWIGFCLWASEGGKLLSSIPYLIFALVLGFSYLLVAEIPMFSFKFTSLSWQNNKIRYIFVLFSLSILFMLKAKGLAPVIGLYILFSIVANAMSNKK